MNKNSEQYFGNVNHTQLNFCITKSSKRIYQSAIRTESYYYSKLLSRFWGYQKLLLGDFNSISKMQRNSVIYDTVLLHFTKEVKISKRYFLILLKSGEQSAVYGRSPWAYAIHMLTIHCTFVKTLSSVIIRVQM